MGERRGTKALELWCRRITDGYPGVKVENMTTSWRDGLAFCALIHHFRPDLLDFNSLRAGDVFRNNALAFRTAEQCLGIPALLDAEDMVAYEVPDRLSILTYLSQFYQYFAHQGTPGGRASLKRTSVSTTAPSVPESPPPAKVSAGVGRRLEPCAKCGHPVFLAERLVIPVGGSREGEAPPTILYHRGCFRCARCDAQLSLANCYETIDGVWCCETCPDELLPLTSNLSPPPLPLSPPPSPAPGMTTPSVPNMSTPSSPIHSFTAMDSKMNESRASGDAVAVTVTGESTKDERDTNEHLELDEDEGGGSGSLVQRRMRIFEKQQILITAKPMPSVKKPDNVQTSIDPGGEVDKNPEQLESRKLEESDMRKLEPERKKEQITTSEELVKTCADMEHSSLVIAQSESELKEENVFEPSEMDNKEVKTEFNEKEEEKSDEIKTEENTNLVEENKSVLTESIDLETKKDEEINENQPQEESSTVPELSIISTVTTTNESDYPDELNPFGSEEDEEEKEVKQPPKVKSVESSKSPPPRPPPPDLSKKTLVPAPKVNLNPFWSDDEGPSSEEEITDTPKPPIPKPRTLKAHPVAGEPSPAPRRSLPAPSSLSPMSMYGSVSSLSSLASSGGGGSTARRKKKPAPAPPSVRELFPEQKANLSTESSRTSSPTPMNISGGQSPKGGRQPRKARPPPPPPPPPPPVHTSPDPLSQLTHENLAWERQKVDKDQANRHRQSHSEAELQEHAPLSAPDKSTYGPWKRKKGPAPPRPVPQRRQIRAMPMKEIRQELEDIEVQQQELERQGVDLEQTIRTKFEESELTEDDCNMTPDVEDLVLHLFELVNEKNELFRRQAELMYLRRQQRLEEEHAEIEYQIRLLLEKPEHSKTDTEKTCEEELIQRLVDIVERRNEIIECLDMDRRREADEDRSIHARLEQFGSLAKSQQQIIDIQDSSREDATPPHSKKKEKKLFVKKEKKKKKDKEKDKTIVDSDKDIDELETVEVVIKEKTKKKWF